MFDVAVSDDSGALTMVASGFGGLPFVDNTAPHGIYPTYFEMYEFRFDGGLVGLPNTQTGVHK